MAKNSVAEKLAEREGRRESSIIAGMVDASPMTTQHKNEKKPDVLTKNKKTSLEVTANVVVQRPEKKNRRKQIILQQSIHDKAEKKCKEIGVSMNEVINQLLQNWVNID